MSNPEYAEYGMRPLRRRIKASPGYKSRSREAIARRASHIAAKAYGESAPEISAVTVRSVDETAKHPPKDGRVLLAVLAACEIPLQEALRDLGLWPDLMAGTSGQSIAQRLQAACRAAGFPEARVAGTAGSRVTIQLR